MPKITKITYKPEKQRYWVFVDEAFCASIRERTFPALNLTAGMEISCDKIRDLENFHWKNAYNKESWEKEKIRLNKVVNLIENIDTRLKANIVGFGADTTEYIKEHPEEPGSPDIEVVLNDTGVIIIFVEVSGTETMRGESYWIRKDKIEFIQNHPDKDIWVILHYAMPKEKFVFIKADLEKKYAVSLKTIKQATEYYIEFYPNSPELKSFQEFESYLKNKIH